MKATIFSIQRNSLVDGPGIRTTVFFKGCNLKCKWCHNPESQKPEKEILFHKNKCDGCGRCKDLTAKDKSFICFNGAKEVCGKEYTADELMVMIIRDKAFYDASDGGVTFSSGECMLQRNFLRKEDYRFPRLPIMLDFLMCINFLKCLKSIPDYRRRCITEIVY